MPRVFFAEANDCNKASNACHKIFLNFFTATIVLPKGERIVYKHKTDNIKRIVCAENMLKTWARLFAHVRMNEEAVRNFSSESQDGGYRYKSEFEIIKERCKAGFLFFLLLFPTSDMHVNEYGVNLYRLKTKRAFLLYTHFLDMRDGTINIDDIMA